MASMSFPTLTDEKLIGFCLEVTGRDVIPITPAAIKNPTKETTVAMFEFFFKEIFGWDVEPVLSVPFELMSKVQYMETHQEQTRVLRFFGAIQMFLARIGYESFSLEDFACPRTKRLRRQLSALVNYALHSQNIMDSYVLATLEEHRRVSQHCQGLIQANKNIKSSIHQHIEEGEQLRIQINEGQQLISERSCEIGALQEQKEVLQQEGRELKAGISRIEDQIQAISVQEAKLNEEKHSLEAQLVGSPEKVRQTLADIQQELQSREKQLATVTARHQELLQMRQETSQLTENLEKLSQKLEAAQQLANRHRDGTAKMKEVTSQFDALRQETNQQQSTNRQLRNTCEMIEESRETQMLKNGRFLEAKREELESRKQVLEKMRSELSQTSQQHSELVVNLGRVQKRLEHDIAQHAQRMAAFEEQEAAILRGVEDVKLSVFESQQKLRQVITRQFEALENRKLAR